MNEIRADTKTHNQFKIQEAMDEEKKIGLKYYNGESIDK